MELDEALTALRSATAGVARALGEADLSALTREQLLSVVLLVDGTLFLVLLALSLHRTRPEPAPQQA